MSHLMKIILVFLVVARIAFADETLPTVSTGEVTSQPGSQPTKNTNGASLDRKGKCQLPEYPASSLRNNEQGTSVVSFLIEANGDVTERKVEKSSGYQSLDDAAISAFSKCQFKPAIKDGTAIAAWKKIAYVWKLERSPKP